MKRVDNSYWQIIHGQLSRTAIWRLLHSVRKDYQIMTSRNSGLKIVWWIDHLSVGGSQQALVDLACGLSDWAGDQAVIVLNDQVSRRHREQLEGCGVEIRVVGKKRIVTGLGLFETYVYLRKKNFDVSITFLFFSDLMGLVLSYLARIDTRITSQRSTNQHYNFAQRVILYPVFRLSSIIHFNCQSLLDRRPSYIPKHSAFSVIPNGIAFSTSDFGQKKRTLRAELGLDHNIILLGNVGRLSPEKGQRYLIELLARLNRDDIDLILVGDGPQRKVLENISKKHLVEKRVHFLGYREDVREILQALNVYVQFSDFEGMPLAVLQAIASVCPVIASDVGGVAELIPNNQYGWVVEQADQVGLVAAIGEAVAKPEIAAGRAERAYKRAKKLYNSHSVIEAWKAMIRNVDS